MPEQRRLTVSSRPIRRRGTPAYRVRPRRVPTSAETDASVPTTDNGATDPTDDPESAATSDAQTSDQLPGTDTAAHEPTEAADATPNGDGSTIDRTDADGVLDLAHYAQTVEDAAARSRSVQGAVEDGAATRTMALPQVRPIRGRVVVGHRVRGGGNGRRGRNGAVGGHERDPRPLLKRPRSWLVIVGIIAAIAAIIGVLWTLNIVRLTYDAYNEAHVNSPDRPVYVINPDGTRVIVPTEQVEASLPNWDNQDPFNILLMGTDDREGDDQPARSDTMIVMRINPATNHVVMMSIPRDLLVYIPVVDRWDKMNAAYPIGAEEDEEVGGPAVVMETINYNFGVQIHYFVTVDFEGFRTIVDTIGGVMIDVRAPVKDDQYPTEGFGITREYFPTGLQMMDGETALRYARTRHGDNDIARGDRQQQMLIAIREQAVSLGLVTRAEELIREFGRMVRTDLNFNQMLALANLGRSVDPNGISRINLWDAGVLTEHPPEDELDAFYMEADWTAVYELVNQYFNTRRTDAPPPTPTPAAAAIEEQPGLDSGDSAAEDVNLALPIIVQNNANISGLATAVADILYGAGFDSIALETGPDVAESTVIYDYAGDPATARYIATQLGIDEANIVFGSGGNGIIVSAGADLAPAVE